jgi:anti-sigma-K factor RskA
MSDPRRDHAPFDELAAGYSLHTLEPDDQAQFLVHVETCTRCRQSLAGYAEVTGALADLSPAAEPSPQLGARILALAAADSAVAAPAGDEAGRQAGRPGDNQGGDLPPGVVPLQARPRPRWMTTAAAAAAAIVIGGGVWGGVAATRGGPPPSPVAGSQRSHQVILTAAQGHSEAAKVIVRGASVWLVPSSLSPDDQATQVYVLWQITGAHTPLAVGSFDVRRGVHAQIKVGTLAASYNTTWAFAVSLEHGRAIPSTPSRPVALGQISS